jgi:HlyD family secretion protein
MFKKLLASITAVAVVLSVAAYQYVERSRQLPEGLIQANGRIEGDTIIIASKQAGRIHSVHVHEGDPVEAGQVLVELDDRAARARVAEAESSKATADARAAQSRAEYEVLCAEVPHGIRAAKAALAASEAALQQAQASERQAERDRQRYSTLAESDSVGWETAEQAALRWDLARNQVNAASAAVDQARQSLANAEIGPTRIAAKRAQLESSEAGARAAEARLHEAQSVLADLTVTSPADGAVTMRLADVGEVVNAGTPLLEVVNLDQLYLEVFVPEVEIGKVRLGLPARVYLDAFPDTPFAAEVRNIAARAEFTPKEIQTANERVNLVYAVKVYFLENPEHRLTPGQPADAVIRWQEHTPWAKPRW